MGFAPTFVGVTNTDTTMQDKKAQHIKSIADN